MRLWHIKLFPYLPTLQKQGQHNECCALRGKTYGKKHYTIDYIYKHPYLILLNYHFYVIKQLLIQNYHIDMNWLDPYYRGKNLPKDGTVYSINRNQHDYLLYKNSYFPEHNDRYLEENLNNLKYALNHKGKIKNIDLFHHFAHIKDWGYYDIEYWKNYFLELAKND